MRVADGTTVEWVEGEAVVLDSKSGELHYLNGSAAVLYALMLEHGFEQAMSESDRLFGDQPGFEEERTELLRVMVERGLLLDDRDTSAP